MNKRRSGALALALVACLPTLSFLTGCAKEREIVLKV